jgi:hypothetical protein
VGLPPSPVEFSYHCRFYKFSHSLLLGGAAAPASRHVCLQLMWEVGLPSSPVEFFSLRHSYKLSRSWLLVCTPAPARALWLGLACLFTVPGRIPLSPLQRSGRPTLFATCLYCSYCLLLSCSFFPGWGLVCPGGYADLAQGCLGSTACCLAHLVHVFPSHLGAGDWRPGGPPGFSILCEVEILCTGWRGGGVKVLPLLGDFACNVCIQCLSKISL